MKLQPASFGPKRDLEGEDTARDGLIAPTLQIQMNSTAKDQMGSFLRLTVDLMGSNICVVFQKGGEKGTRLVTSKS